MKHLCRFCGEQKCGGGVCGNDEAVRTTCWTCDACAKRFSVAPGHRHLMPLPPGDLAEAERQHQAVVREYHRQIDELKKTVRECENARASLAESCRNALGGRYAKDPLDVAIRQTEEKVRSLEAQREALAVAIEKLTNTQRSCVVAAVEKGYEPFVCDECKQWTVVRNGDTLKCGSCGTTRDESEKPAMPTGTMVLDVGGKKIVIRGAESVEVWRSSRHG